MRQRDERKEKAVTDTAMEMIVTDGVEGFSMNKLSRACGISVATLYIYYKDKDDLIKQLGLMLARAFFASSLEQFSPDMPFKEGLRIQWQNRKRFALENPVMTACFEILRHTHHGEFIVDQSVADFKNAMHAFTDNAVKNNQLISLPVEVFWSIAYGPLYTLMRFHREGKGMGRQPFVLQDSDLDQAFEIVIKALTP